MIIGVPKEIKNNENRVAMTPAGVVTLMRAGHQVVIEAGAGAGSSFLDEDYIRAGAIIVETAGEAWDVDMVMKVKEPIESEFKYFKEGLILFTYLHLATEPELTQALVDHKVVGIAYETVQLSNRSLPLLTPMSEVAGKMAIQLGAQYLENLNGGKGILLGGVSGVQRGKVTVIGGGIAGTNAAKIAVGMGADVTILDVSPERLRQLDDLFGRDVQTLMSNSYNIAESIGQADLVVGAVLIPGAKAPKLVTTEMVASMQPGSVVIDIAIDQGGIFETSDRVTTHDDPVYVKHGVVHYAVANMPGAVPRTSTVALTNNTVPYALEIANKGYIRACMQRTELMLGLNVVDGEVVYEAVADSLNLPYTPAVDVLNRLARLTQ